MLHPRTGRAVEPQVPFARPNTPETESDPRKQLVKWLTSEDNPLFARSYVNRVWSYFFGIGIIEPVDDIRTGNPPGNLALLDALTEDFIRNGLDRRDLMRTICQSRTYQLSFLTSSWNEDDRLHFSHAQPRRLSAEQILDAVGVATGEYPSFQGLPRNTRAVSIPDGVVAGDEFLSLFGRPNRASACECERSDNLGLSHAIKLINGATINDAICAEGNGLQQLVERESDNRRVVEEIYYSCLNRPPSAQEVAMLDTRVGSSSRLAWAQDLAWALINSPAFLFNH